MLAALCFPQIWSQPLIVRALNSHDVNDAAAIHAQAFSRQQNSVEWVSCLLRAYPRTMCFVCEVQGAVCAYIVWTQKSGFRKDAVVELEQVAVAPDHQNRGIGRLLIQQSLVQLKNQLNDRAASLKSILVSTRSDNYAQSLYKKTLGAEVEATLSGLYSADEVFMVARSV